MTEDLFSPTRTSPPAMPPSPPQRRRRRARSHRVLRPERWPARRYRGAPLGGRAGARHRHLQVPGDREHSPTRSTDGATAPPVGTAVIAEIDWDRRHILMRTHTALHALSGVVFTDYGARVTGGNMDDTGSARMDFELDSHESGVRPRGGAQAQRAARRGRARARELPAASRGARRPRPDPHEGVADPRPRRSDPRDRHRGHRQAGRRWHPRALDRRGRHRRVVKTESKGKANKRMRIQLEDA